jgi:hypothetical protein
VARPRGILTRFPILSVTTEHPNANLKRTNLSKCGVTLPRDIKECQISQCPICFRAYRYCHQPPNLRTSSVNKIEAKTILEHELNRYRLHCYGELQLLVDTTETFERSGPSITQRTLATIHGNPVSTTCSPLHTELLSVKMRAR